MDYEISTRTYQEIDSAGYPHEVLDIKVYCDKHATVIVGIENPKTIQTKDVFIDERQ